MNESVSTRAIFTALVALSLGICTAAIAQPPAPSPGAPTSTPPSTSLTGTSWRLVRFQGHDGKTHTPADPAKYTIQFVAKGMLTVRVDCNRGRGTWRSTGVNQVEFEALMLTRAECARGSIDKEFIKQWPTFKSYAIRDGHLFLAPMAEGGTYEFEPLASAF